LISKKHDLCGAGTYVRDWVEQRENAGASQILRPTAEEACLLRIVVLFI